MKARPLPRPVRLFLKGWAGSLAAALLIAFSFKSAVADWYEVPTGSMKPTIVEGDRIFVNKLAYDLKVPLTTLRLARWGDPGRGDIVVFASPLDGTRLVKRVIGLPGDLVEMRAERLRVNGEPAAYFDPAGDAALVSCEERLGELAHRVQFLPGAGAPSTFGPVRVPAGKYLMLGDNRDNSADSRFFGFVDRDAITGRALAVVVSLDYERHHLPRAGRFFLALR